MKQGACKAGVAGSLILVGLLLLPARIQGAPFTLAVLGDSISDTYFLKVSLFERSWTDQLCLLREGKVQLHNKAVGGNTSVAMRLRRQPDEVAQLVRQGAVRNVCLMIGANDLAYRLLTPDGADRPGLEVAAATLVENVANALDTVRAAGPVAVVLGNVPDLGDTPAFHAWALAHPAQSARLTRLTAEVNQQLAALARERAIPVVDLCGLVRLARPPVHVGGIEVSQSLYVADGLHPSTIGSALLANAILEAFRIGHGRDVGELPLSDGEILAEVGRTPTAEGNFDVSRFVILERSEPPRPKRPRSRWRPVHQLVWSGIGVAGLLGCWLGWRRRCSDRCEAHSAPSLPEMGRPSSRQ